MTPPPQPSIHPVPAADWRFDPFAAHQPAAENGLELAIAAVEQGQFLCEQQRWAEVMLLCRQAIRVLEPGTATAYRLLGWAMQEQGNLAEAEPLYRQAIAIQPTCAETQMRLGSLYAAQSRWTEAIDCYQQAIGLETDPLQQQRHLEAATACYRQAIAHHPDQAALYAQLGNLLAKQGQKEEAVVLHQKAIALCGWQPPRAYRFTYDWFTHNLPHWRSLLHPYAHQPHLQFLEVGSFEGMASCWLLDHILTHPSARLTTIDPAYQPVFDGNLAQSGQGERVNKLTGSSHHLLPTLPPDTFEVIYIDGCHLAKHVEQDARLSWSLLKSGGLMIFDDYLWSDPQFPEADPRLGIDAFLDSIPGQFERVHQTYQLVIRKG